MRRCCGVCVIRVLPFAIELVLFVFCLIDIIQSPQGEIRNLPKWGWIVLIIIVPLVGCVAWLVAGRPSTARRSGWSAGRVFPAAAPPAPDRDPAIDEIDTRLKADLEQVDREHDEMMQRWEDELRNREQQQPGDGAAPSPPTAPDSPPPSE